MMLIDFDGKDGFRFSPYVWRSKLALTHLGLGYDTTEISFLNKSALESLTTHRQAPVLLHHGAVIADSWNIALYLHRNLPAERAIFENTGQIAFAQFLNTWVPQVLYPACLPMIAVDVISKVREDEQTHYRITREAFLGCTLEEAAEHREKHAQSFSEHLNPLRAILKSARYLNGNLPGYSDYIMGALFLWIRSTSPFQPIQPDDVISQWRKRLFDQYEDLILATPGYEW